MTVFVDPDVLAPLLRQSIYDGLVVLTNLPSVRQFVDDTRGATSRSLQTLDPQNFNRAVTNDYCRNNTARLNTASQISDERQVRPAALNYTPVDDLVVVPTPGAVVTSRQSGRRRCRPPIDGVLRPPAHWIASRALPVAARALRREPLRGWKPLSDTRPLISTPMAGRDKEPA
jgi:hypothetical protein